MLLRPLLFVALAVPAIAAFVTGCGDGSTPSVAILAEPTLIRASPDASDEASSPNASGAASATEVDAAASPPAAPPAMLRGNPLCNASPTDCYPDDVVAACDLPPEAGTGGPDANGEFTASCHVVAADSPPVCLAGGGGMKNSTCSGPTECAAGHECIGTGFCHRYCCSGNSECAVNEFCDVQSTTLNPLTLVPVCMPELPCVLLDNDACPPNEQCGVVKDDGSTSCVAIGMATAGQSCERIHCGPGLLCLGAEGARQCATLCYKGTLGACKATQKCTGALPLFLTPTVGVCQ